MVPVLSAGKDWKSFMHLKPHWLSATTYRSRHSICDERWEVRRKRRLGAVTLDSKPACPWRRCPLIKRWCPLLNSRHAAWAWSQGVDKGDMAKRQESILELNTPHWRRSCSIRGWRGILHRFNLSMEMLRGQNPQEEDVNVLWVEQTEMIGMEAGLSEEQSWKWR